MCSVAHWFTEEMHPVLSSSAAVYLQSLGPLRSHPAASSVPPPAFRVWAAVTRWRLAAALALLSYARPRWVAGAVDLLWSDGLSPMLEAAGAPRAAAVVWEQLKDGMLWLLEVLIKTRAGQRLVARLRRSIQHRIAKLHEFAENKAKTATQKVLDHLRTTLKDPDMPGFVLEAIDETIDMISPDVSEEVRGSRGGGGGGERAGETHVGNSIESLTPVISYELLHNTGLQQIVPC